MPTTNQNKLTLNSTANENNSQDLLIKGLNNEQKEAVLFNHDKNGPLLIIAGAGSGKTSVLCKRIQYLINNNIKANNILALTFTVKAANEMRERVEKNMPSKEKGKIVLSTFHSLALRLIKDKVKGQLNRSKLGLNKNPEFTDLEHDFGLKLLKKHFNQRKNSSLNDVSIDKLREHLFNDNYIFPTEISKNDLYRIQHKVLETNIILFDDLIFLSIKLLKKEPEIVTYYQNKFKYILLDEYQDINPSQYTMVRLLLGESDRLFAVGDDDQAIYAFRGADIRNILMFKEDFPHCHIIKLEWNYRSTDNILRLANRIFKNKPKYLQKHLKTGASNQKNIFKNNLAIEKWKSKSMLDETKKIVNYIIFMKKEYLLKWSNFAILVRYNRQVDNYKAALEYYNIPIISKNDDESNPKKNDAVVIQTLHASKGLQYTVVFYAGLMENLSPTEYRGDKKDKIKVKEHFEQEQRLFYVGVTRAEAHLILLYHHKSIWKGKSKKFKISRFFNI